MPIENEIDSIHSTKGSQPNRSLVSKNEAQNDKKNFTCPQCGKKLLSSYEIKKHLRFHVKKIKIIKK